MTFLRVVISRDLAECYQVGRDYRIQDRRGLMTCECREKVAASDGKVRIAFECPREVDTDAPFVVQQDPPPQLTPHVETLRLLKFFSDHKR